jgi:predicted nucleotidyltransferase
VLRPPGDRTLPTAAVGAYDLAVRRSEVIEVFNAHREDLRRLGISSLLVFGSVARDEARPGSDVDLIAEFDRPIGYLGLARVQHELEELLGCGVDLATPGMIRKEHRDRIYAEAVRAA